MASHLKIPVPSESEDSQVGWKRFLLFSVPLVFGSILQALSSTFNTIYTGQLLGQTSYAAIAVVTPLLVLVGTFVMGFGSGAAILSGRAWGAKDVARLQEIAGTTLFFGAALGLVIALAGPPVLGPILERMNSPNEVIAEAVSYGRVMAGALPLSFMAILSMAMLRGTGNSAASLIMLAICAAVVLVLTPAFILGWAGLPPMGVASAAWATTCGTAISLVWLARHLRRRQHPLAPSLALLHCWRPRPAVLWNIFQLGIPTGLFFVTGAFADLALMKLVNGYGKHATAAWGIVNQLVAYVQFPATSIAIAATVFSSQSIGRGASNQLFAITRTALCIALAFTGMAALLMACQSERILGIMTADKTVVLLSKDLLGFALAGSLIIGLSGILTAVMRASSFVFWPTCISLSCLAFVLFPLGWGLSQILGLLGIRMAYTLTYALGLAMHTGFFYFIWKKSWMKLSAA